MPRRQALEKEDALQQRDVVMDRLSGELERPAEIRDVYQLSGVAGGHGQEPRQRVERPDAGEITHVTLHLRLDVVAIPCRAPRRGAERQRSRVAAGHDAFDQCRAETPERLIARFDSG